MERLSKYRQAKRQQMRQRIRESQGTSQQFRLAKHGEIPDSPAAINPSVSPAPEAEETSPQEEEQPMETEEQSAMADDLDQEIHAFLQEQESPIAPPPNFSS